jgi:hypothetical protein
MGWFDVEPSDGRCFALQPRAHRRYAPPFADTTPIDQEVNALGFRGPAIPTGLANPGMTRIAMLGDSFVYGMGVQGTETLSARLSEALAAAGKSVEVLNFGVPGYNTKPQNISSQNQPQAPVLATSANQLAV